MVKELIAAGLTGDALLREVMKVTGYDEHQALFLIAIETGQSKGDVIRTPETERPPLLGPAP